MRRMLAHHADFVRFAQDNLRGASGELRPDALDRIQDFWRSRGFYIDWELVHDNALVFTKCVFAENLS